jgi:hypothetical protein
MKPSAKDSHLYTGSSEFYCVYLFIMTSTSGGQIYVRLSPHRVRIIKINYSQLGMTQIGNQSIKSFYIIYPFFIQQCWFFYDCKKSSWSYVMHDWNQSLRKVMKNYLHNTWFWSLLMHCQTKNLKWLKICGTQIKYKVYQEKIYILLTAEVKNKVFSRLNMNINYLFFWIYNHKQI